MKFKIVGDSCCDLTKKELEKDYFYSVPLTLNVGGVDVTDDESFCQERFMQMVENCPESPKSSCPSPDAFMRGFEGAEEVYVVTLSAKLSGSYNSALLAKQIYQEEHPEVKVHVFDSKTAAAGEHLICGKIEACATSGMCFDEVVKSVEEYISGMTTIFVLEDLSVMQKNGRLSRLQSIAVNMLNIKLILHGVDGEIQQLDQARGMNKALNKLLRHIEKGDYDRQRKVEITQCCSRERCLNVRRILMEQFGFKNVQILDAGGVSTMYESRGGVVVSF